jgi:hypothetical protein
MLDDTIAVTIIMTLSIVLLIASTHKLYVWSGYKVEGFVEEPLQKQQQQQQSQSQPIINVELNLPQSLLDKLDKLIDASSSGNEAIRMIAKSTMLQAELARVAREEQKQSEKSSHDDQEKQNADQAKSENRAYKVVPFQPGAMFKSICCDAKDYCQYKDYTGVCPV